MRTEYTFDTTDTKADASLEYWPNFSFQLQKEKDNGKFYLTEKVENKNWKIREIKHEEIQKIDKAHQVLHDYLFLVRKKKELKKNYDECVNTLENYKTMVKELKEPAFDQQKFEIEVYTEVNRVFTNFLSSFKSFIELNEMRIKREYKGSCSNPKEGKCKECLDCKSDESCKEFKAFKKTTKYCYDKHFSYAFFYKLRNFANHHFFPIERIHLSLAHLPNEESEIEFYFDKKILLHEKYEGADIIKVANHHKLTWDFYDNSFRVLPILLKIQDPIKILSSKIFEIEEDRFTNAANVLMRFYNEGIKKNRVVSIVQFSSNHIDSNIIRTDLIEEIRIMKQEAEINF